MERHPSRGFWLAVPLVCVFVVGLVHATIATVSCRDSMRAGLGQRQSATQTMRAQTLARLRDEFDAVNESRWTIVDGCPRRPEFPAVMSAMGSRLFVATEKRLECYDVDERAWKDDFIELPEHVGTGLALANDGEGTIYLASGGDRSSLWRISLLDRKIEQLPDSPQLIGRGGALTYSEGELYLAPGRRDKDFLRLDQGASTWHSLGPIGGVPDQHTSFGRNSGFLAKLGPAIYAWPDHHVRKFDLETKTWESGTWLAMGFRPSLDGGGVASDEPSNSIYAACGMYSRSLNEIVTTEKRGKYYFVKPRLPYPMIGEGDRVAIARKKGIPHLFVYAVEPDNRLCHLPCSQLARVDADDAVADEGSLWRRLPLTGGGNGVRRRKELDPGTAITRSMDTLAAMGSLDRELFIMRRAFVRRMNAETGIGTHYPGINLGRYLALGAAGTYGEGFLYMCTGKSTHFVRWEIPETPPQRKLSGPQPPIDHTDLEILPSMPGEVGRGAALAHHDGIVYAVRGGVTRDFWRYTVAQERWDVLAPLPAAATAMGDRGTGLVAVGSGVYAVPDERVWRYEPGADRWGLFTDLGFAPDWDGGMVTNDGERHLYVVRGDISTRFGRLDLRTRRFEELLPRPPDAISAEGNRLAVMTVDGERRLYVHRGHNSNEILWIRIADLETLGD